MLRLHVGLLRRHPISYNKKLIPSPSLQIIQPEIKHQFTKINSLNQYSCQPQIMKMTTKSNILKVIFKVESNVPTLNSYNVIVFGFQNIYTMYRILM